MPFYRFEDLGEKKLTPHLSSARGPIIEGEYFYFCMVSKDPGTGSDLPYHPNELMIFPVAGKIHALVGKDRRIVHLIDGHGECRRGLLGSVTDGDGDDSLAESVRGGRDG